MLDARYATESYVHVGLISKVGPLQALADGLTRPRTTKKIDKLWERIGRLKEKSHGAGQHYHIEIIPDAGGEKARAIRWQRQPIDGTIKTHPGVYCLRSNERSWDAEQL